MCGKLLYDNPACSARMENLLTPCPGTPVSTARSGLTLNLFLPKDKVIYVIQGR
jgi:hypothetical protein